MTWTPEEVIKIALAERDIVRDLEKQVDEHKAKIKLCEAFCLNTILGRKEKNIKTDDGVAYLTPSTTVTSNDRQGVIDFTLVRVEDNDPNAFALWTNHVTKEEAVRLTEKGIALPFLTIETKTVCHIRKA